MTSHPARQVIAYDIASQLASRGSLAAHLAAVYYDQSRAPYSVERYLPSSLRRRATYQLSKRRCEGIPDSLVHQFPWVELASRAGLSIPPLRRHFSAMSVDVVNAAHDFWASRWLRAHPQFDVLLAYQGSALRSLNAARQCGAAAVLVATHPLTHERIVAAEYAKFGRTVPAVAQPHLVRELRAAEWFLTASRTTTDGLLEHGVAPGRIKELAYGLAMSPVAPVRRGRSDRVRFVFVGKLSLHKGLHVLRDAWAALASPGASLTIVGRPVGDIEARIVREWQDPRVQILPEVADIATVYQDADVFVFPSLVEGFGMVTLEAMSLGLPVIVTGRSLAVARDEIDGLVVAPGDAAQLSAAMARLAGDAELRARLGESARARAEAFTWTRFGNELEEWLVSVKEMA